jgi:hypothetical protein
MQEMSLVNFPDCHLAHVANPQRRSSAAIWICEYPYRTMRATGPSSECGECPVWQALLRRRGLSGDKVAEELEILESMAAS